MFKAYLLLFCGLLISAKVVATEHEIKMDNLNLCATKPIRVKKIERYNHIIKLLEEAGAIHEEEVDAVHEATDTNTVFGYFRSLFRP